MLEEDVSITQLQWKLGFAWTRRRQNVLEMQQGDPEAMEEAGKTGRRSEGEATGDAWESKWDEM